ncbi:hypothetical protein GUITHDRAFT_153978 [Guillardia theta CCMP2712]|uniref:Uncharacterized protein n=1 Tax=Guillardia theta (strain CCMP2712) TaxID=905079 RepID=L1IXL0_GUITC|nr:hypothetical protein GUITHDRAFT_153978 [Guillardia theta CCMP2712]EKX41013.1 hypothetical protein GUITHDRAFT_153978 [Guillardia theta CCMP2712]|eukprot:XP_005827993.1 hypothetical protein GUITHDRAFT_153978 [Guillardia theta CCMP2712]
MGAGRSVQRVAAVEAEDSGGARERKAEKVKEKKSRSRARQTYVDVEDDHVALPQHLVLGQDMDERGRFIKMTRRPLMSLISSEGSSLPGLPAGLRTDGFYFQPHLPAGEEEEKEAGGGSGSERRVQVVKPLGGGGERVYYVIEKPSSPQGDP